MMNVKERTDRLFKKGTGEKKAVEGIVGLMKYFGWTHHDVFGSEHKCYIEIKFWKWVIFKINTYAHTKGLPLPSYFVIMETVNEMEKRAEQKSKRKR